MAAIKIDNKTFSQILYLAFRHSRGWDISELTEQLVQDVIMQHKSNITRKIRDEIIESIELGVELRSIDDSWQAVALALYYENEHGDRS